MDNAPDRVLDHAETALGARAGAREESSPETEAAARAKVRPVSLRELFDTIRLATTVALERL